MGNGRKDRRQNFQKSTGKKDQATGGDISTTTRPQTTNEGSFKSPRPPQVTPDVSEKEFSSSYNQAEQKKQAPPEGSNTKTSAEELEKDYLNEHGMMIVKPLYHDNELSQWVYENFPQIVIGMTAKEVEHELLEVMELRTWFDMLAFREQGPRQKGLITKMGYTRYAVMMKFIVNIAIILEFVFEMKMSKKQFWPWEEYLQLKGLIFNDAMAKALKILQEERTKTDSPGEVQPQYPYSPFRDSYKARKQSPDHDDPSIASLKSRLSQAGSDKPDPPESQHKATTHLKSNRM